MFTFRHIIRSLSGWCDFLCRETMRHAIGKILRCHACTKHRKKFNDYVTTVTMMSSEGAKNACLVVSQDSRNEGIRRKLYYGTNLYEGEEDTATGIVDVVADDVVNVS